MAGFKGLGLFKRKFRKKLDGSLHKVTKQAFANLVEASPVLLGNFRASWLGSVLTPRASDPLAFARVYSGQSGSIQSFRGTNPGVSKGAPPTALETTNLSPALKAKFGQLVYITNNIAYATPLERGRSPQAPNGVLHVSAQKTRAQMSGSRV